ncbi:peptidoglycan glycosyltransferase [Cellulomonas dongxiuzhuiae]|uniref:Peptidoglycan glycosyltransferase n=1 Tax=Cellulomonas dongxiuzhuiae TaxID=2819979 RepID=A0ABX8GP65_9CELL|nr:peptidoglycan glycosyltransferase [Cellulomonas dongxiuzhuiae]QWC17452.1 peptidoglycan glycosyltransferase [Cellulomonas dongxiuzhuiae]
MSAPPTGGTPAARRPAARQPSARRQPVAARTPVARRRPADAQPRVAPARGTARGTVGGVEERSGTVPRRRAPATSRGERAAVPARRAPSAAVPRGPSRPPAPPGPAQAVVASRGRMIGLVVVLSLVLVTFAGRLVYVQGIAGPEVAQEAREKRMTTAQVLGARGEITDANGVVLATSVERYHVTVNQKQVASYRARGSSDGLDGAAGVASRLAPVLGLNAAELGGDLVGDRGYVVVARNVLPDVAREVRALRLDGVGVEKVADRVYPKGTVAGNIVGFVNSEGEGLQGLEFALHADLKGTPGQERFERGKGGQPIPGGLSEAHPAQDGRSVRLTLDSDLQWKAEEQLRAKVAETGADGGAIVVMRRTGEVLALAESVAFDPNTPGAQATTALSRSVSDVFEPGSTGKVVTIAAALEEGLVQPTEPFEVADRWTTPHGETIKDSHDHAVQKLTATGVFAESSNVGTVLIGQRLTKDQRYQYLSAFGFGARTGIEMPGESAGLLRTPDDWHGRDEFAVLFGQAVSVNALQAASVFATIANDGVRVPPRLIAGWTSPDGRYTAQPPPDGIAVVSPQTAQTVLSMMESTVVEGTGKEGAIPGYRVGGKTGTAQRFNPSGYTASFIGVAPVDDPEVITAVILHNPRTSIYGGTVAAPVFATVTGYALQQLGIAPSGAPATLFPATWE